MEKNKNIENICYNSSTPYHTLLELKEIIGLV
jgi:hypothetical protein